MSDNRDGNHGEGRHHGQGYYQHGNSQTIIPAWFITPLNSEVRKTKDCAQSYGILNDTYIKRSLARVHCGHLPLPLTNKYDQRCEVTDKHVDTSDETVKYQGRSISRQRLEISSRCAQLTVVSSHQHIALVAARKLYLPLVLLIPRIRSHVQRS